MIGDPLQTTLTIGKERHFTNDWTFISINLNQNKNEEVDVVLGVHSHLSGLFRLYGVFPPIGRFVWCERSMELCCGAGKTNKHWPA